MAKKVVETKDLGKVYVGFDLANGWGEFDLRVSLIDNGSYSWGVLIDLLNGGQSVGELYQRFTVGASVMGCKVDTLEAAKGWARAAYQGFVNDPASAGKELYASRSRLNLK